MVKKPMFTRSFLTYPGNKFRNLKYLLPLLRDYPCLVEPFCGSGVVFLNANYRRYILNDSNKDISNLYTFLQKDGLAFINKAKEFFSPSTNNKETYDRLRKEFNESVDVEHKAALFVYINKHCFNGVIRYNKGNGYYNIPYGGFGKRIEFPQKLMEIFYAKLQNDVTILNGDFKDCLNTIKAPSCVYCDPPYIPLSKTSSYTEYDGKRFTFEDHKALLKICLDLRAAHHHVVISNNDTEESRVLYASSVRYKIPVLQSIAAASESRKKMDELIVVV